MKQIVVTVAALLAGFVGGILGTLVIPTREQSHPGQVVRARSFELVNESGQAISYWGVDEGENAVLAFGRGGAPGGDPRLGLRNPHKQLAAIGLVHGGGGYLKFRGEDGETRVRLLVGGYEKPALLMEDETGPRVSLGIGPTDTPSPDNNNWSLDFAPGRVMIGMYAERDGTKRYVRGFLSVDKGRTLYPYGQPK